jgi:Xaa-Pro aminopeptidase
MSVTRIALLRRKYQEVNLDGMIITDLDQVRYLSGYTGSAGLLVLTDQRADFFTDFRYTIQARKQVKGARVHTVTGGMIAFLGKVPNLSARNRRYGITTECLTLANHKRLQEALPSCLLIPADDLLTDLGWVKDKDEVGYITKAVQIGDIAFERILNIVKPGIRESEVAAELEYQMLMLGAEKRAFETIVASGYRSAMPHGVASQKKIKNGEFVTFDFGATVEGYVSDMTRTVLVGKATPRQKKIYNLVLKAQMAGIRKIKAGVACKAVDDACRRIITKAGYGKEFGHGTGHGIGFVIHTGPRVSPLSEDKLMVNNIVTVEPGIYIDGWGGVRIEDDVLVTRTGGKVLNRAEKKLLEL